MTAFSTNQLPNSITTLEELAAWVALALANINPTATAVEGPSITERVAQAGVFYVSADNKYRMLIRLSLQVSPDHLFGKNGLYNYVQEISQTSLPAGFSS